MSKKPPPPSMEGGAPEWMVSYADMITIVMAFFVVLYATTSGSGKNDKGHSASEAKTQVKQDKQGADKKEGGNFDEQNEQLQKVFRSLCDRFGPNWTVANCWTGGPTALRGLVPAELKAQKGDKRARSLGRGQPNAENIAILKTAKPGEIIVPGVRIFFQEFSADINDAQKSNLSAVAEELAGKVQKFEIRGHTSRQPLPKDSPFTDHIDLAFARCLAVCKYLSKHNIDPRRMRLAVAAENEPTDTVSSPSFGEKNSRVEIRLLNEWVDDSEKEQSETPASAVAAAAK